MDRRIVCELSKHYKIHYLVIYENKTNYIYTPDEVALFCNEYGINYTPYIRTKRVRHPDNIKLAYVIIRAILASNSDVIYFEAFSDPYLLFMAKVLLDTRKIIVGIHDVIPHKTRSFSLSNFFNYLHLFNNFHVFSETQKKELLTKYPNKKVFVARLTTYDFGPVAKNRPSDNVPNFLFFGAIRHNKGLECLIEAGNLLASRGLDFIITIAGSCNDFAYYDELIKYRNKFDLKIRFIDHSEIPSLFAKADFLVLPYLDVTQSGPLMVAFNYNVLPIASNLPGFKEYISHGKSGLLFEVGNPAELSLCMEKAMSISGNDRETMINNILNFTQKELSIDSIISSYISMYDYVSN